MAHPIKSRKPINEDEVEPVWIKHPETGVVHKVNHQYHINRLIAEGGKVVSGPSAEPVLSLAMSDDERGQMAAMQAEIDRLQAQLAAVHQTPAEPIALGTRTKR